MAQLRPGTCSWKSPSWSGLVYSAPTGVSYLVQYARHYDTVEVDQWFWSRFATGAPQLPEAADVEQYRGSVPDSFRFTVKVPNGLTLTHLYSQRKSDPMTSNPYFLSPSLMTQFLSLLDPLADLLGPLIFQFEYLNRQKLSGLGEFQRRFERLLATLRPGHQYAVETRNATYLNAAYFDFLRSNRLVPVLLQGYWMPDISQVYQQRRSQLLAMDTVVIRLHGPDRQAIERQAGGRWDRVLLPRDQELRAIAQITQEMLSEGVNVYVNVNNHYEGSAPLSIARLLEFIRADRKQGEA